MYSNKNFSNATPATLQDIMYISNQHVRTVIINGEPWFVAKDVCDILDIKNSRDTLKKVLSDWESDVDTIYTRSSNGVEQKREVGIVNESGLYHLIFISRKPEAEAFRRWVTQDLLPTLRRTGRYEIGKPKRKRLLPRDREDIDPAFFTELRKYVLPSDLKAIATEMGLTLRHVQKTLSGTTTSYPVMERLVHTGMQNRKKGIHRIERKRYVPLISLFTEEQLNGLED